VGENARRVIMREDLPTRATPAERVANLDADIRDATAKLRRRLSDYASKYTVTGWTIDEGAWEMAVADRKVVCIMRLTRAV
jgi:hypothetical protein